VGPDPEGPWAFFCSSDYRVSKDEIFQSFIVADDETLLLIRYCIN